ncbi:transcriptional regulator, MucR family [Sphingomonas laterariae]|uniref:Transcriptional regulator, MucR family n=1 Tax=Edaphosphingomonas laterariae TaxID=861865 RepID=A0A239KTS3_9SPHN|nr:MucR family transcriptional regulator [Sphingomonas laterariae]SNT20909.1 transcriptional regulator, MucR family [Sphingomonas laterariae]
MPEDLSADALVALTADIVSAHAANNVVAISDVPVLIAKVHAALSGLGQPAAIEEKPVPAVSIRSSLKPDHIVCLECGKRYKSLRRHLRSHDMIANEYRTKWNLPESYPMAAPNYSEQRKQLALQIGLGRKPGQKVAAKAAHARMARQPRPKAIQAAKAHLSAE